MSFPKEFPNINSAWAIFLGSLEAKWTPSERPNWRLPWTQLSPRPGLQNATVSHRLVSIFFLKHPIISDIFGWICFLRSTRSERRPWKQMKAPRPTVMGCIIMLIILHSNSTSTMVSRQALGFHLVDPPIWHAIWFQRCKASVDLPLSPSRTRSRALWSAALSPTLWRIKVNSTRTPYSRSIKHQCPLNQSIEREKHVQPAQLDLRPSTCDTPQMMRQSTGRRDVWHASQHWHYIIDYILQRLWCDGRCG